MVIQRLPVGIALSVALLAGACGDEGKDPKLSQSDSSITATPGDGGTTLPDGKDGSIGGGDAGIDAGSAAPLDGSLPDGATPPTGQIDGSAQPPLSDGSTQAGDAALVGDGGSVVADGGSTSIDASAPDAAASVDAGPCPINHPTFGCGHAVSDNWVVFDNGLEIDRANKLAWTPVVEVLDDDALRDICTPLALGGLTGYSLPQMSEVRTLAAGCAATVPGGSCQVDDDEVLLAEAGDCTCTGGAGPNNGKFCRPEVPDCETLWAWTHTFETGWYQHWFYDVTTGSIVPEYVGVGIALTAKGRCVRPLTDEELLP